MINLCPDHHKRDSHGGPEMDGKDVNVDNLAYAPEHGRSSLRTNLKMDV